MKIILPLLLLLCFSCISAQKREDSKIIVTLIDTTGLYQKVKLALINTEFIVKDDGNRDTLTTYAREFNNMPGFAIARAVVKDNQVILTGAYGLKKMNDWGYTTSPKSYKRIIYFKGSKGWQLLMQVVEKLGGDVSFSQ